MKVAIVHPGVFVYGGAEILIVRLCNYLSNKGVENALITTCLPAEMRAVLKSTRIISCGKRGGNLIDEMLSLRKLVFKNASEFDIINVHNFPAELSVAGLKKNLVWMCNEPSLHLQLGNPFLSFKTKVFLKFLRFFEEYSVKKYFKKSVVSDISNSERFYKIYGIKPEIVNYGIDWEYFSEKKFGEKTKKEWELEKVFSILQVGMLTPFKNQMATLKALNGIRSKVAEVKVVFAGYWEDAYKKELDEYIRVNSLGKNVIFLGHVDRSTVRSLMHSCDMLFHPIEPQGGWLSPYEAISAGMPVVVSKKMTSSDIIEREKIGVVTSDYETAILDVMHNPGGYKAMAVKGLDFIKNNLNWEKYCSGMLKIYSDLLQGNGEN